MYVFSSKKKFDFDVYYNNKVLFTDHCRWQNFRLSLVNNCVESIYKTQKTKVLFTDHCRWQNFRPSLLRLVNHSSPWRLAGEKKVTAIIIKQQSGFPMSTT